MLISYMRTARSHPLFGALVTIALGLTACGGGTSYGGSSSTPLAPAAGNQSASPTAAPASPSAVRVADVGSFGKVLTDSKGMTLYIRKSDPAGGSSCTGNCATTWPPLSSSDASPAKPDGLTGDLGTFARDDGTKQITYNGQALYTFSGDKAPGDATGQGIGGVWFVASAQAGAATSTAAPTSDYNYGY